MAAPISTSYAAGFDPGGRNAFGWAVLSRCAENFELHCAGTCSDARSAFKSVARSLSLLDRPIAIGVDAPLYWVLEADRRSDQHVRGIVLAANGAAGTVGHVNSLRGACLVQGIQVLRLAHGMWPQAAITEAHPKALLLASEAAARVAAGFADRVGTEHERDAVLAAYSGFALTVQQAGWLDLVRLDPDPYFPSGCRAAYWFPENRLSG